MNAYEDTVANIPLRSRIKINLTPPLSPLDYIAMFPSRLARSGTYNKIPAGRSKFNPVALRILSSL